MHVQDERAFNFNDSVYWAIDQCSRTAFELDMNAEALKDLNNDLVSELFDEEYVQRLSDFLTLDLLPSIAETIPQEDLANILLNDIFGAYMELVTQIASRDNRKMTMDMYLQAYSRSKEKEIIGIETMQEQLKALFTDIKDIDLTDGNTSQAIIERMQSGKIKLGILDLLAGTDNMTNTYATHNLSAVCDMVHSQVSASNALGKMFYKRLFDDRNHLMFERTVDYIEEGELFIAVGSGHLCGETGLVEQFRNAGFTVRPMNISVPFTRPIVWEEVDHTNYNVKLPSNVSLSKRTFLFYEINEDFSTQLLTNAGSASFSIQKEYKDRLPSYQYDEDLEPETVIEIEGVADIPIEEIESADEDIPLIPEEEDALDMYEDEVDEAPVYNEGLVIEESIEESETDDGERDQAIASDNTSPKQRLGVLAQDMQGNMSDEHREYYEGVFTLVKDSVQQNLAAMMMRSMQGFQAKEVDSSRTVIIHGKEEVLTYEKSILGASLKATVEMKDGQYVLEIKGDPALLKSKEIEVFFTSFTPRI